MKIKEIMAFSAITVYPDTNLLEVSYLIFSNRFHGIPVINKENEVVGIITEDDFFLKDFSNLFLPSYIKFLQEKKDGRNLPEDIKQKIEKLSLLKASDIMSENCITVSPETGVDQMMETIKKTKFTTFPVVSDEGKILGIVTLSDILGIVKKGSREMSQAIRSKQEKLKKLASDINYIWDDKIVLVSKKQVRTWKGILFISIVALLGLIALLIANRNSKVSCEIEQKSVYPIECQQFVYSNWSACNTDGTQIRKVTEKLPKNCEGGEKPETVRPCQ